MNAATRWLLILLVVIGLIKLLHEVMPALAVPAPITEMPQTKHADNCASCAAIGVIMPEGHSDGDAQNGAEVTSVLPEQITSTTDGTSFTERITVMRTTTTLPVGDVSVKPPPPRPTLG